MLSEEPPDIKVDQDHSMEGKGRQLSVMTMNKGGQFF
jgi:hypothetical protein